MHRSSKASRNTRSAPALPVPLSQVLNCSATGLLSALPGGSIGAIITDPPFHISLGRASGWDQARGVGADPWTEISDIDESILWTIPVATQCARVLRPGGSLVVMGGLQSLHGWTVSASKLGLKWMAELVILWSAGKPRVHNFGSLFTRMIWYCKPGGTHTWNSEHTSIYSNVLVARKIPVTARTHPSEKPVGITNFLISLLTRPGDVVVDPFCGSGSTLVSAEICDRPWIGCDTDLQYCGPAQRRARHGEFEEYETVYLWTNGKLQPIGDV